MDGKSFTFKSANFSNLNLFSNIAMLGRRGGGKSTWTKYLVMKMAKDYENIIVFCGHKGATISWSDVVCERFIHLKDLSILRQLQKYQETKVEHFRKKKQEIPKKYRVLVIFDDCGSDKRFMKSSIMDDFHSNARHYGIAMITLVQYFVQIPTQNREQLDYIGMLYTLNANSIDRIHKEYLGVAIPDRNVFSTILNDFTQNYGLCWISNVSKQQDMVNRVYYKTLKYPIHWRMCTRRAYVKWAQCRDFSNVRSMYNYSSSSSDDEDEEYLRYLERAHGKVEKVQHLDWTEQKQTYDIKGKTLTIKKQISLEDIESQI